MKFKKWTILSKKNSISKKVITSVDDILIKSYFGNYLKVIDKGLAAYSNVIEESCIFNIKKADELVKPNWSITRPFLSKLFLTSKCIDYLSDNELFFSQVNY